MSADFLWILEASFNRRIAMTQEEKWDKQIAEFKREVEEWKAGMDTDTRREVRNVWTVVAALTGVLGFLIGYWFF